MNFFFEGGGEVQNPSSFPSQEIYMFNLRIFGQLILSGCDTLMMLVNTHQAGNGGREAALPSTQDGGKLLPGGTSYFLTVLRYLIHKTRVIITSSLQSCSEDCMRIHVVFKTVSATKWRLQNDGCYYSKNYGQITILWW